MRICRLSHGINSLTPVYGGVGKPSFELVKSISNGDSCNESMVKMKVHTSTHVDFPIHFNPDGKSASDWKGYFSYDCAAIVDAQVIDDFFYIEDLPQIPNLECLIVNVPMSCDRFQPNYYECSPGISIEATEEILRRYTSLKAIMMNTLSLSSFKQREVGRKVHRLFLDREILIFEDVNLDSINLNIARSTILVSALFDDNVDGSPVVIFAVEF